MSMKIFLGLGWNQVKLDDRCELFIYNQSKVSVGRKIERKSWSALKGSVEQTDVCSVCQAWSQV